MQTPVQTDAGAAAGGALGESGLRVSPLGLGMAALGRPGYINLGHAQDLGADRSVEAMRRHAWAVLDAAWSMGVRYFDAARSYGLGEAFLGGWLAARGIGRDDAAVGSKWGYTYTADWRVDAPVHEVKEHGLTVLRRQWAESCAALVDRLQLYQIHSATFASGVLENIDVLSELARLKSCGVAIGLTVSGPEQPQVIRRALDVRVDGRRLFDCVQATWNLLERSAGPALAEAAAEGVGVIVKEALANGRLAGHNPDPTFAGHARLLDREAARLASSVDALALAAVLARPFSHVVLSGAATETHLRTNLGATTVRW
jgi:aryl-alcohol dehydrogenase-like predicted oxidoreductase